jgi:hypothetical protein
LCGSQFVIRYEFFQCLLSTRARIEIVGIELVDQFSDFIIGLPNSSAGPARIPRMSQTAANLETHWNLSFGLAALKNQTEIVAEDFRDYKRPLTILRSLEVA